MKDQKKLRLWLLLILIALAGMFSQRLMGGGDTSQTKRIIGESSLYSQAEIEQMMDTGWTSTSCRVCTKTPIPECWNTTRPAGARLA